MKLDAWLRQEHPLADRLLVVERLAQALNEIHDRGEPLASLAPDHVDVDAEGQCDISAARRGTPSAPYGAPERLEGGPPSPEADIYSAGAIAWEVLSGRRCGTPPQHLSQARPDLPRELADAIMACLEQSSQWRPRDLTYVAQLAQHAQGSRRKEPAAAPARSTPARGTAVRGAAHRGAAARASRPSSAGEGLSANTLRLAIAGVVLLAVAAGGYFWFTRRAPSPVPAPGGRPPVPAPNSFAATTAPAPTAPAAVETPPPPTTATTRPAGTPTPFAPPTPAYASATPVPPRAVPTPTPVATAPIAPVRPADVVRPTPAPTPEPTKAAVVTPPPTVPPPRTTLPPADTTPVAPTATPATPPPVVPTQPATLTAVSPLSVRRPGKVLVDVRGTAFHDRLHARVLQIKEAPRGITVLRQKVVSDTLMNVLLDLDATVAPGPYAIALEEPSGRLTKPLTFTVTK